MSDIRYLLSFDCADKTLGICCIGWLPKDHIEERLECIRSDLAANSAPADMAKLVGDMLFVKNMWLFNLLPDSVVRDTDDAVRLGRLKAALGKVRSFINSAGIKVSNIIVEYQMGQNDLSRLISAAIIYEFCDEDNGIQMNICGGGEASGTGAGVSANASAKVHANSQANSHIKVVMPAAKNSFHFHQSLSYGVFAAKYKTNKTANKHHTAENFKYFLQLQNSNSRCKKINFDYKHAEINHISDAFMQAVYWIFNQ